jgi:hypothetical protein
MTSSPIDVTNELPKIPSPEQENPANTNTSTNTNAMNPPPTPVPIVSSPTPAPSGETPPPNQPSTSVSWLKWVGIAVAVAVGGFIFISFAYGAFSAISYERKGRKFLKEVEVYRLNKLDMFEQEHTKREQEKRKREQEEEKQSVKKRELGFIKLKEKMRELEDILRERRPSKLIIPPKDTNNTNRFYDQETAKVQEIINISSRHGYPEPKDDLEKAQMIEEYLNFNEDSKKNGTYNNEGGIRGVPIDMLVRVDYNGKTTFRNSPKLFNRLDSRKRKDWDDWTTKDPRPIPNGWELLSDGKYMYRLNKSVFVTERERLLPNITGSDARNHETYYFFIKNKYDLW